MAGHVFVTRSDITSLRCDAWLLPTDQALSVTPSWVGVAPGGKIPELEDSAFRKLWRMSGGSPAACKPWRTGCGISPAPIPVLVSTGGTVKTNISWYREKIREFVAFALPLARERHETWRSKHLLAVPFIGTGDGGQFLKKGEMAKAILSELSALIAHEDFDAVLCVRDDAALAAAQQNRQAFAAEAISEPSRKQAEKLAEHARGGNLVLFLGAGISQQAGLPMWSQLIENIADAAGMTQREKEALLSLPSVDAASVLESRLKSQGSDFGEMVADATRSECFGLGHSLAAGLPVRESVTTNYDDLFEVANQRAGKSLAVLPYQPSSTSRWLLKLHGSLDHPEDIVLTRGDFMRYENSRAALYGIVQAMLMTRHILFVGFSLTDENFHRLADEVRVALDGRTGSAATKRRGQFGTALVPQRDDLFRSLWSDDIELLSVGSTHDSVLEVARDIEIILDYVSYRASSISAHLLDDKFTGALDSEQHRIKESLRRLIASLSSEDLQSSTFAPFAKVLKEHGGLTP